MTSASALRARRVTGAHSAPVADERPRVDG